MHVKHENGNERFKIESFLIFGNNIGGNMVLKIQCEEQSRAKEEIEWGLKLNLQMKQTKTKLNGRINIIRF